MEVNKIIEGVILEFFTNNENSENNINKNFWRWFANSKVVDNTGKPLIVYHGSSTNSPESPDFGRDTYFTDDYYNADGYAMGEHVYEVYLRITKPLIIDSENRKWDDLETQYGKTTQDVVVSVDRSKYDGVIFINIKDSWIDDVDYQDASTVYVTFNQNQIKSIENDGTWDIGDRDIYS